MILLCCKEMNVNKQKNKMMGKNMVDKKGRARLQLKGRIFMQNVTDTVMSSKPGMQFKTNDLDALDSNLNRFVLITDILEGRPWSRIIHY
jgi:hypothetical protein